VDMQLGLREAPELIKLSYQQTPGHTGDRVDLVTAYQRAGRQLMILGPPGSGKTTQVLGATLREDGPGGNGGVL
jgi:MoxR-like ATPase